MIRYRNKEIDFKTAEALDAKKKVDHFKAIEDAQIKNKTRIDYDLEKWIKKGTDPLIIDEIK